LDQAFWRIAIKNNSAKCIVKKNSTYRNKTKRQCHFLSLKITTKIKNHPFPPHSAASARGFFKFF
jgi:hypothetical protein